MASQRRTVFKPLMKNPSVELTHNKERVLKAYNQQIKKLHQNIEDKKDVIESEEKLLRLGHAYFVRNIKSEQKKCYPMESSVKW